MAIIEAMAFVNGSHNQMPGNVTYFMEPFPDEKFPFTAIKDWFRMDNRTGVVQLLQSPQPGIKAHNVSFMIGALEHDKSLDARAPAVVLFHGLPSKLLLMITQKKKEKRNPQEFYSTFIGIKNMFLHFFFFSCFMWSGPRNVTVTKLSADAAVICWKFPLAAGAQGYVLRYWRHPASLSPTQPLTPTENEAPDSAPIPLELKIIDLDGRANLSVSRACHFCSLPLSGI
jgi:hypothetical protein